VPLYINQEKVRKVIGSEDQIHQVVLNLVLNAIDALTNGGNIYMDISNTEDPKGVRLSVRDTGIGIKEEAINHLFDPFYSTKESGLGLGLFICKQIVDEHNGYLEVESQVGEGTEFTLWLPEHRNNQAEE
jgi:signal transduction histidine kinase